MTTRYLLEQILVENSTYLNTHRIKLKLIEEGVFAEKCFECGIGSEWNGIPLSLQLDHINGINNDHRLENLRLLCPNCHSQTKTYAGKNRLGKPNITGLEAKKYFCKGCSDEITRYSKTGFCRNCYVSSVQPDIPPLEELLDKTNRMTYKEVGKIYGVSAKTITNWIRSYR